MRIVSRMVVGLSVAAASLFSSGCAGGGGGGGDPVPATIPGVLGALAVQGGAAPGGGTYGLFPADMLLSAAQGGWVAFVVPVTGGPSKALFVAQPNGTVVRVFAIDETVPANNGATGTFSDFRRIWMRPGGIVVVDADVAAGVTRGFFTARADGAGGVVEKACAIRYGNQVLTVARLLTNIDESVTEVTDDGHILFEATDSTFINGLYQLDRAGGFINPIAQSGNFTSIGDLGIDFHAVATDASRTLFVFAADVQAAADEAIFATTNGTQFLPVAKNTDVAPNSNGRPFGQVFNGPRLLVSWSGGVQPGYVTWRGTVTGGAPNAGLFRAQISIGSSLFPTPAQDVIGVGETLIGVGGAAPFAADVATYDQETGPIGMTFRVDVAGGSTTHVFARLVPTTGAFLEMFRQGTTAPRGSTFGTGYPSLNTTEINDAGDRFGGFAFSAVLVDASTGVFWDVTNLGLFNVVKQGDAAPGTGGGTFDSFAAPSAVSTAYLNVAFRSALVGASGATGVFRQN